MEVHNEHLHHYTTEIVAIRTRNDVALRGKKNVHAMNYLVGLIVLIPLLAILFINGGNAMLTVLIVLALVPLGYIFIKFF